MAQRRMFSKTIIDSDAFLSMPSSTQMLYFHLCMRADDDGFVSNPKTIMRLINSNDDDYNLLIMKRFILVLDNGVIVIKHWRINNYLRNDRYQPTNYREERKQLFLKDNGSYTLDKKKGRPLLDNQKRTAGIPMVDHRDTQVSIGKVRLGKVSKEKKERKKKEEPTPSSTASKEAEEDLDFIAKLGSTS